MSMRHSRDNLNYIEVEELMRGTYNGIAEKYVEIAKENWKDKEYIDKFLDLLQPKSKILDIGCGTGELLKYYDSLGFKTL